MKNLFLILILVSISYVARAQVYVINQSNGKNTVVDVNKLDLPLIQMVVYQKFMSRKIFISIDYGQTRNFKNDGCIVDSTGKKITFREPVSCMNYLEKRGWKYINSVQGGQGIYFFTFHKRTDTN
ncbi:hypothetical protein IH575_01185 [Candidatus Dojkabacteria bacterium]|nr:hypothetical protein [Candidatus Dojkabacteria bacterium]